MIAIIACVVLLSLVAAALATVISRAVTGPLGKAVHAIQAVARVTSASAPRPPARTKPARCSRRPPR